jgi:hypothetical protein
MEELVNKLKKEFKGVNTQEIPMDTYKAIKDKVNLLEKINPDLINLLAKEQILLFHQELEN